MRYNPDTVDARLTVEVPITGSVSAHYTVRCPKTNREIGNINDRDDANLFAKTLVDITNDSWHVIEHKFTESTIAVHAVPNSGSNPDIGW